MKKKKRRGGEPAIGEFVWNEHHIEGAVASKLAAHYALIAMLGWHNYSKVSHVRRAASFRPPALRFRV